MTEPTLAHAGPPSAAQPLFILAMDHRDSFGRTLFEVVKDPPTSQQLADMRSAKSLVFDTVKRSADPGSLCIVLGRNAPKRQVDHWLDVAAPLEGYVGFAIGRSIWDEPLADFVAGRGWVSVNGSERVPASSAGPRSACR